MGNKKLSQSMFDLFSEYGWKIKTGKKQRFGSPSDVYLEYVSKNDGKYFMMIDDGNCPLPIGSLFHVYCGLGSFDGKVFEGRINTNNEFKIVMKVLGFALKK